MKGARRGAQIDPIPPTLEKATFKKPSLIRAKMASATVETICFQDKIPVILNTSLELELFIKGHHVYIEVWALEVGKKLNLLMEPNNLVDKFAVCVEKYQTVVDHLKKRDSGKFAKMMFYFLRRDAYCNCFVEVSGKR